MNSIHTLTSVTMPTLSWPTDSIRDRAWLVDLLRQIPDSMLESRRCPTFDSITPPGGMLSSAIHFHIPMLTSPVASGSSDPNYQNNEPGSQDGNGTSSAASLIAEFLPEDECLVLIRYLLNEL